MKALIVVDIQKGLTEKPNFYQKEKFISTVNESILRFRSENNLVIFVQHNNKLLIRDEKGWEYDERIDKSILDITIQKIHADSFRNTDLATILKDRDVNNVYICGITSHSCVKYTCFGSLTNGFHTSLIRDAHSCWNENAMKIIAQTEKELAEMGVNIVDVNQL